MNQPEFTNHFICAACKIEFHNHTSDEKRWKEHEERAKTLPDYDLNDETVVVCDDCFRKIIANVR